MELIRTDEASKTQVKVEWSDLGEGICGDYNEDDPNDVSLLRFDISVKTCDTDDALLTKGLTMMMDEVFDAVVGEHSIKKCCERLSWISPDSITNDVWDRKYVL
jgi:hypothetical protein